MPQPATCRLLLTSLCAFVERTLSGYPFPSPDAPCEDCRVFLHGLPEAQDAGTWPFVICRLVEGELASEADGKTVLTDTVALILGVHAPASQAQAGLLLAELMDALRAALWRERLLAGRFELQEPVRARVADMEQKVHKFHLATLETTWNYVWPPKGQAGLTKTIALGRTSCAALGLASPQTSCGSLRSASARVPAGGSE